MVIKIIALYMYRIICVKIPLYSLKMYIIRKVSLYSRYICLNLHAGYSKPETHAHTHLCCYRSIFGAQLDTLSMSDAKDLSVS